MRKTEKTFAQETIVQMDSLAEVHIQTFKQLFFDYPKYIRYNDITCYILLGVQCFLLVIFSGLSSMRGTNINSAPLLQGLLAFCRLASKQNLSMQ